MEVKLVCDIKEQFKPNMIDENMNFSDHAPKENIEEIKNMVIKNNYRCTIFGGIPELIEANKNKLSFHDDIFLNLTDGLDMNCGRVQAPILLDMLKVTYSGASPFQASLIDNKFYTKLAVKEKNILVPDSMLVKSYKGVPEKYPHNMHYPVIVKPNCKGSSVGISQNSICYDSQAVSSLLAEKLPIYDEMLIEEFIPGYEITNFIIGNSDSYYINEPILEEFHGNFFHDKEVMAITDKAYRTRTFHTCESILGTKTAERIKETSKIIKETLGVNDILRIDYRLTEHMEIYFLEANTVPRISSKNEAGFICKVKNIPYHYFIGYLIKSVLNRKFRKE